MKSTAAELRARAVAAQDSAAAECRHAQAAADQANQLGTFAHPESKTSALSAYAPCWWAPLREGE